MILKFKDAMRRSLHNLRDEHTERLNRD